MARARGEHHQAAPDATSCGGASAESADTLQEAETWLRTALDLVVTQERFSFKNMDAQMHLACVAMMKGDEDEAVELLSRHLHGWVDVAPCMCAGCGQMPGEDASMLLCDGCHVVRCVYAATPVLCGSDWHCIVQACLSCGG